MLSEFKSAEIKVSIPKGELQDFCLWELRRLFDVYIPGVDELDGVLGWVSDDKRLGVEYARNKDCGRAVVRGFSDLSIIGTDRFGDFNPGDVVELQRYRTAVPWRMVVAVPEDSTFTRLDQLQSVATQYRVLAERYLAEQDLRQVVIEETTGGTEMKPYSWGVDGVVELTVSGRSLQANRLRIIQTLDVIEPVLIANKEFITRSSGRDLLRRLESSTNQ